MRNVLLLTTLLLVGACDDKASNSTTNTADVSAEMDRQVQELEAMAGNPAPQSTLVAGAEGEMNVRSLDAFDEKALTQRALAVISEAGHSCYRVVSAFQVRDDSVVATCDDGERYRIGRLRSGGQEFALKCSAMTELGMENAC
jgi:hypothetical protein